MTSEATAATDPPISTDKLLKIVTAGAIGNILEWYDFTLYAYFAPTIGALFFATEDPVAQLLSAFGVFAGGYLMRPIGSFVFGWLGDRIGRKRMLIISVLLMAIPSAMVGMLPTYDQVGNLAPCLLVVLRLLQGLSVGGEFTGSAIFLVEYAPPGRRGIVGSTTYLAAGLGMLLASLVGTLVTDLLTPESVRSWGWRIPFMVGIVAAGVCIYLRSCAEETPSFRRLQERGAVATSPFLEMLVYQRRASITTIGLVSLQTVGLYVPSAFLTSWMITVEKVPAPIALAYTSVSILLMVLVIPIAGHVSDRVGRKPVLLTAALGTILLAYPMFRLMAAASITAHEYLPCLVGQVVLGVLAGIYQGALPTTLVEMFHSRSRATAMSVSYSLAAGILGGTTPLICTWLVDRTQNILSPAFYLMLVGLVALLVISLSVDETYDRTME